MSAIDWEKIQNKPEKDHKVPGQYLLDTRKFIEMQEKKVEEQNQTIKNLNEELKSLKTELETRGNKIKEMVEKIGEMNEKFDELNKKSEEINAKNEEITKENETLKQELKTLKANNELQETLVKEKNEAIQTHLEEIEQLKQTVKEFEEKIDVLPSEDEINEMKEKLETYPSLEEIEELRRRPNPDDVDNLLISKDEEIEKLNKEIHTLKSEMEDLKVKVEAQPAPTPTKIVSKPKPPTITPTTAATPTPSSVDSQGPKFTIAEESKTATFSLTDDSAIKTEGIKKRVIPQEVLDIFENLKMAIQGGIRAGELHKLMADSRDAIANIFGFSQALKRMGDVAKKLKKAPPNAQIDESSVNIFLKKIEEWKQTMEGG